VDVRPIETWSADIRSPPLRNPALAHDEQQKPENHITMKLKVVSSDAKPLHVAPSCSFDFPCG